MPARAMAAFALAAMFLSPLETSYAQSGSSNKLESEVDTEHIFGFTQGSDIGKAGDREPELESFLGFGKQTGSYLATSTALSYKYSLADNFRIAPVLVLGSHNVDNVPGLPHRDQFEFEGAGGEIRYRVFDREHAPFGLTLSFEPGWSRIDRESGERVDQLGLPLIFLIDKDLISHKLYGAINIGYEPEWTRKSAIGGLERNSTLVIGSALTMALARGVFIGAETRYFRKYEGIALNDFSGQALFVGPTLFVKLSEKWSFSAAWNMQVAGHAVGEAGNLDLKNFDRNEVLVRVSSNLN